MPLDRKKKFKGGLADGLHELREAQKRGETTDYEGQETTGTSIFDPVLCELSYRWFCPEGGKILDPFAGGSVRGIVAATLGFDYTGIDLSVRQLEANKAQAETICKERKPRWINGDSRNLISLIDQGGACPKVDFVFACPPYFDLEVYSDDPADLSACDWQEFRTAYRAIIKACFECLKPNRFACFVVGDVRDKGGNYRNLPGETVAAWEEAGAKLYNEAILVTSVGSLPVRVGKQFSTSRKLGKTHQNVLVFLKGDSKEVRGWPLPDFGSEADGLSQLSASLGIAGQEENAQ
jgi:DNA modification methylase